VISVAEIIKFLRFEGEIGNLSSGKLEMKYFNKSPLVGIGRDSEGRIVLVLPAQNDVSGFQTEYAEFDPSCNVFIEETDEALPSVATLRCAIDRHSEEKLQALAAIIKGIAELQEDYGRCGKAIHEMKDFFNNNFHANIPASKIVGLIGELLVIAKSSDKNYFVGLWHSSADASFDFSSGNSRVEVKTTRSLNRIHQFSSNQISESLQATVFVASVSLQVVEKGMSFGSLVKVILADLNTNMKKKFMECVIETIGIVPELVNGIEIDFDSSLESIWLIPSDSIPSPKARDGVLSMEWRASIGENLKTEISLDDVFAGT
jgi:hypothetical protein